MVILINFSFFVMPNQNVIEWWMFFNQKYTTRGLVASKVYNFHHALQIAYVFHFVFYHKSIGCWEIGKYIEFLKRLKCVNNLFHDLKDWFFILSKTDIQNEKCLSQYVESICKGGWKKRLSVSGIQMRVQSNFYVNARLKPPRTLSCISHYTSVVSKVPNSVVAYARFLNKSS